MSFLYLTGNLQESYIFFDILTFDILALLSSSCECNTIIVKSRLLFIDLLNSILKAKEEDLWSLIAASEIWHG